jgi:hypothetical protein
MRYGVDSPDPQKIPLEILICYEEELNRLSGWIGGEYGNPLIIDFVVTFSPVYTTVKVQYSVNVTVSRHRTFTVKRGKNETVKLRNKIKDKIYSQVKNNYYAFIYEKIFPEFLSYMVADKEQVRNCFVRKKGL